MAASTTPRPTPASLASNPAVAALERLELPAPVAIAFSGGADSTALLHAAVRRWPGQVFAIHVDHGLQAQAKDFVRQCRATCTMLDVPLDIVSVDARHRTGDSPEDAARRARYAALAQAASTRGARVVLLAQHADDQVETILLALSRGAGLPGLAAMPAQFERHGVAFRRPLLAIPGAALRGWLQQHGIGFVDDPMNADMAYMRTRIRRGIMPALERAFPQFRDTFARSARHAAQAQALLDELGASDLATIGLPPVVARLQTLSRGRQANALRHWLRASHAVAGSEAQLGELLDQVAACTTRGHAIRLKVADGRVELCNGALRYVTAQVD
jgi:tRNA(Ile)-lysidine synthase